MMNKNDGTSRVDIRPLCAADRVAWGEMWHDYLSFYETTLPTSQYDITFARLTDAATPSMGAHIAQIDGTPGGLVHYIFHDHCWLPGPTCYLQDLFTKPSFRGLGIGAKLIESVYRAADDRGAHGTYWLTQEFNHQARSVYDRVGELTPFIKYKRA